MALYTKWESGLKAIDGTAWHVAILVDALAQPVVGDVWLDGDQPLTVEWPERDVDEAVHGSAVTLRVVSPSDRALTDLYTIAHGKVVLEIRDAQGELWWTGALDPEFYEEPYECLDGYTVELTFCDFGCLDRYEWDANVVGLRAVGTILNECLSLMGLEDLPVDKTMVTTKVPGATPAADADVLTNVFVTGANFIDEEGEAMKMNDVLTAVLMPLGLHVVQKAGKVWVYDLNGLALSTPRGDVEWSGDSQTLGVAPVASRVTVTFSPYADAAVADGEVDYDDVKIPTGAVTKSVYVDMEKNSLGNPADPDAVGFEITPCGSADVNGVTLGGGVLQWVKIHGIYSGNDEACIAWGYRTDLNDVVVDVDQMEWNVVPSSGTGRIYPRIMVAWDEASSKTNGYHNSFNPRIGVDIVHLEGGLVEAYNSDNARRARLKITMEALLDPRYNPFESAGDNNLQTRFDDVQDAYNMVYIPAMLRIVDPDTGTTLAHWENWDDIITPQQGDIWHVKACGDWVLGNGNWGSMVLAWYDWEDRNEKCGITGWATNKTAIALIPGKVPKSMSKRGDGEFLPLPPVAGKLVLDVCPMLWVRECEWQAGSPGFNARDMDEYTAGVPITMALRWALFRAPRVEIVDYYGDAMDNDDVEYRGELIAEAKDDVDIDTICGTMADPPSGARGLYRNSDGTPLHELRRRTEIDRPERLLINTVYSQMGSRHTTLEGEAAFDADGFGSYNEQNQGERVFMVASETVDLRTMTADSKFIEVTPDEYAPQDIV